MSLLVGDLPIAQLFYKIFLQDVDIRLLVSDLQIARPFLQDVDL